MRQTWLICKRSLGSLFRSPLAYVVITLFLLCSGFFFYHMVLERIMSLQAQRGGGDAPAMVCREFWRTSGWILLFVVPIMSMGSIAGEKSRGTIELLLTSPLRFGHLIVGKYLSLLIFLAAMLAPTGVYFAFLRHHAELGYGQIFAGYLGGFLLGAAALALGVMVSALTRSQAIAGFGIFGSILIFWFVDAAGGTLPSYWRNLVRYFSLYVHYRNIVTADVGLDDVAYFLSFTVFFLFMAHLSVKLLWARGKWG